MHKQIQGCQSLQGYADEDTMRSRTIGSNKEALPIQMPTSPNQPVLLFVSLFFTFTFTHKEY